MAPNNVMMGCLAIKFKIDVDIGYVMTHEDGGHIIMYYSSTKLKLCIADYEPKIGV